MSLFLDDGDVKQWEVQPDRYQAYSVALNLSKGIHKVEIAMANEPEESGGWDLVVDYVDIRGVSGEEE